ncbi:MAG: hypothetical protein QE510_00255 [Verrucomicrobiota bacterium]|nr:hypothetical protein [Verrucomicrobiota bacterium]
MDLKRVGQGHQPVDQAVQLSDFQWRVTLVEELDGEFEAVVFESLGFVAVLLGAEVGGDDEEDLLVAVARVVEFALEVDGVADAEVEGDAAAEGLVLVRCGAPLLSATFRNPRKVAGLKSTVLPGSYGRFLPR